MPRKKTAHAINMKNFAKLKMLRSIMTYELKRPRPSRLLSEQNQLLGEERRRLPSDARDFELPIRIEKQLITKLTERRLAPLSGSLDSFLD
jgi:hypothetical protein